MSGAAGLAVETVDLGKRYGTVTALAEVNLRIESGQYFVLLGPSGGGKTTLLRLVGGLIRPDTGRVLLHGVDMTALPANERPTTVVFQSYALFPHMTVERNVGFGLRLRKLEAKAIRERVERMLALVGLEGYGARMPHELSGGQQQRVQLARSLVLDRDVLLLDEPLAALDEKLRKEMCLELKRIQEQVGITFVHVTHNQEEAMTVADRLAIIADGRLVEEGSPRAVYEHPVRRFTADFIGEARVFDGRVVATNGAQVRVDIGFAQVDVVDRVGSAREDDAVSVSIPSERLRLFAAGERIPDRMQTIAAAYAKAVYLGLTTSHIVELADGTEARIREISQSRPSNAFRARAEVRVGWHVEDARLHVD